MAAEPPPSARGRLVTGPWAVAAVLAVFYVVLLLGLREKSATFDEPGHAAAGYVYWRFGDFRIDPENGNLPQRWFAVPLAAAGGRFPPPDAAGWREANAWRLADAWFNRLGNDPAALLARGRAMAALLAVALAAAVWGWARRRHGPAGGMVALLLAVSSPALLANGGLMTSDTAAALGFLLAVGGIWLNLAAPTWPRLAGGAVAIAGLFLAKMSAALLLPMALLLAGARVLDGRPLPLPSGRVLARRPAQAAAIAAMAAGQTLLVVALVWAAYGFRYSAFSDRAPAPRQFQQPWAWALQLPAPHLFLERLDLTPAQRAEIAAALPRRTGAETEWSHAVVARLQDLRTRVLTPGQGAQLDALLAAPPPALVPRLIHGAREHRLLPEAFLYGYAHVWRTSGQLAAFFRGEIRQDGWLGYFPFVFAVKTPLAFVALLGLAAVAAGAVVRQASRAGGAPRAALWAVLYPSLPLLILILVYGGGALGANLNIGHRHLLPLYPPLFILAGASVGWLPARSAASPRPGGLARWRRYAAPGLVGLALLESAYTFPNYIAYFNGLISPAHAYRHVIDSSLDWGQELPAIARYLRARPGETAHLAYFGVGSPAQAGITARHLGGFPAMDWKLFPPLKSVPSTAPADLVAFLREHPDYDPDLVFRLGEGPGAAALLVRRSAALRLGAGLYVISASMLQPVYCGKVAGFWDSTQEQYYQQVKQAVAPFLSDDYAARRAHLPTRPLPEWLELLEDFYDFRLARLTSYLRRREPVDRINAAVLVYRLTAAEVAEALEGPPPVSR